MACSPQFLAADSVSGQSSFLRDLPPGKYEGIIVRFSGDAQAAQTFAVTDLGRIRLTEGGRDLVSADADNIRFLNTLKGGNSRVQATAGGASAATLHLPRGYWDNNVHQIIEADVCQVAIQFGALFTTKFQAADPAQIKIYGLVRDTGEMSYNLLLHQIDQTYADGTFTLPLRHENVCAIYPVVGTAPNTTLDRVRVMKDGEEFANVQMGPNPQDSDLADISDLLNATDAPDPALAITANGAALHSSITEIAICEPGEVGEYLSDDVTVEYTLSTSGATVVQETLVVSADFTPSKLRQTRVDNAAKVQRKIARKNTLGRGRPVQALRISAGG